MSEKIDQLSEIATSFLETLKEDPVKAAGFIALGYVAIHVTILMLKALWRLKWLIAVVLVIAGVTYAAKRGDSEPISIDPDMPVEPVESPSIDLNETIAEEV
jgi:hypothetical protein